MNIPLDTEQEAAVAILFSCVLYKDKSLTESEIEQLSRMLVLSSKFKGHSLNDLTKKELTLQAQHGRKTLIEEAAPLISENFRETLFAMACEIVTADGNVNDQESELLAMTALYMGLPMEKMKMMLTTYLIRNRWNVQIVEQV